MEKKLNPHTEKLRVERAMMDLTGASRSQLRKGLRDFDTVVRGREALRPREAQPGKGAAGVQVQEVAQPIRELPPRPEKNKSGRVSGATGTTIPILALIQINGTLQLKLVNVVIDGYQDPPANWTLRDIGLCQPGGGTVTRKFITGPV